MEVPRLKQRITPQLAASIRSDRLALLEAERYPVFALDGDLRLAFLSRSWFTFASDNGGEEMLASWGIGRSVLDATPEVLRPFYREGLSSALGSRRMWAHEYLCSSPDKERRFRMLAAAIPGGLVVSNALVVELEIRATAPPDAATYADWTTGLIHQCASCRRTSRAADPTIWDFVPAWVAKQPPNTTHVLCPTCTVTYELREALD